MIAALCLTGLLALTPLEEALAAYARADAGRVVAIYRGSPPQRAQDFAVLGKALYLNGDFAKAAEAFSQAVARDPNRAEYRLWLGRATGRRAASALPLRAPGLAIETRKHFERAVELDPRNAEALSDLFDYYLNAPGFLGGGEAKAAALIPKVRAIDPAQAFYLESKLAEKRKDWDAAEAALGKAAAGNEPGRLLDLARFYARRGRLPDAEALFRKVDPNYPPLYYARAEALAASNPAQARALLERYLTLPLTPDFPTRREAEKLLAKIP